MGRAVLFAIFLFACAASHAGGKISGNTRYSNTEYGFAVTLPRSLPHQKPTTPAPNHGTVVELPSGGRVWIDGSHDASFLGSARAALDQILSEEDVDRATPVRTLKLATLRAASVSFTRNGKATARVTALRLRRDGVAIVYTLGLDTDDIHAREDTKIFDVIVRTFTLLPLPQ